MFGRPAYNIQQHLMEVTITIVHDSVVHLCPNNQSPVRLLDVKKEVCRRMGYPYESKTHPNNYGSWDIFMSAISNVIECWTRESNNCRRRKNTPLFSRVSRGLYVTLNKGVPERTPDRKRHEGMGHEIPDSPHWPPEEVLDREHAMRFVSNEPVSHRDAFPTAFCEHETLTEDRTLGRLSEEEQAMDVSVSVADALMATLPESACRLRARIAEGNPYRVSEQEMAARRSGKFKTTESYAAHQELLVRFYSECRPFVSGVPCWPRADLLICLHDKETVLLVEAKSLRAENTERQVLKAVAQLKWYAFLLQVNGWSLQKVALFDQPMTDHMARFLQSEGVCVMYSLAGECLKIQAPERCAVISLHEYLGTLP